MRDSQRAKFWKARSEAIADADRFICFADKVQYIKKVMLSKWFQKHFGRAIDWEIVPHWKRWYEKGIIHAPRWVTNDWLALASVAHAINPAKDKHGRSFCEIYLKLVHHFIGKEAAARLKAAYKANRIKYRQKRSLSFDRTAQLRERGQWLAARRKFIKEEERINKLRAEHIEFIKSRQQD